MLALPSVDIAQHQSLSLAGECLVEQVEKQSAAPSPNNEEWELIAEIPVSSQTERLQKASLHGCHPEAIRITKEFGLTKSDVPGDGNCLYHVNRLPQQSSQ